MKLNKIILDTNLLIVANGQSEQAQAQCILDCIEVLERAQDSRKYKVVLDNLSLIIGEYRHHVNPKGQPGVGDFFFKWLWDNQYNCRHCEIFEIHPLANSMDDFEEFPKDSALTRFDRSDRKFVATCISASKVPIIINSVDSDWRDFEQALKNNGIKVENICSCIDD